MDYPMQPIDNDRFESNPIVEWLATEVCDMNRISLYCQMNDVDNKYQEQLAQLVGYSVSGYGMLSYVSDESYDRAFNQVQPGIGECYKMIEKIWGSGVLMQFADIVESEEC